MEQQMLSRQKEVSDRLFTGMGRIADRYAVCDLARDRYEYRENMLSKPLYPESGRYRDFIELMSRRYLVLGKAEGMKMDQILDPEYLRRVLRKDTDILKFEYCIREKNVYALLNIIPIEFDGEAVDAGDDDRAGRRPEGRIGESGEWTADRPVQRAVFQPRVANRKRRSCRSLILLDLISSSPSTTRMGTTWATSCSRPSPSACKPASAAATARSASAGTSSPSSTAPT
ncbi:MAG: hypothetical protein ACLS6G_06770 [Christensenellales bacterium]